MDLAENRFGKTWKHFLEVLKVVQVLGMALRLLSLHARRRLQSCLTLWLEAGKRNNRRVQPRFRIRCLPAGEGTEATIYVRER